MLVMKCCTLLALLLSVCHGAPAIENDVEVSVNIDADGIVGLANFYGWIQKF